MESHSTLTRLQSIRSNFCSNRIVDEVQKKTLQEYKSRSTIDANALRDVFYGSHYSIRDRIFKLMANDLIFRHHTSMELNRKDHRYLTFKQIRRLKEFNFIDFQDFKKDPNILLVTSEAIASFDQSLATKLAVHFALYVKTLQNLGTTKHTHLIEDAIELKDLGCFALTEIGHGSNVRDIKTTAVYDHEKREFVINTLDELGIKFWIGGAAHTANMCVVFAQLYVKGKCHGVHAFVVPIRSRIDHSTMSGITIGDCGAKLGANGIDNGFLIFRNVRIPYENLLDKFSQIKESGEFKSSIQNDDKRFGISLGSLGNGRISVMINCNCILRNVLTIGIRYASVRKQFGKPGQPETSILDYPLTQYRLLPYLAGSFAYSFATQTVQHAWEKSQDFLYDEKNPLLNEFHALSSCLKALISWYSQKAVQEVREICGGLGYSSYNRIGALRDDNDINATWEGDNNVLLQQTSKFLLENLKKKMEGKTIPHNSLDFLKPTLDEQTSWAVTKEEDITQNDCIKRALEHRANYLVHESMSKIQENLGKFDTPLDAWNGTQVYYLQSAAKAFGELYTYTEFVKSLKRCQDKNTKKVLKLMCDLFGLTRLEQDLNNLYESNYVNPAQGKMIKNVIVSLCSQLKDEANGLVDIIAPPDEIIGSPIGYSDGDIYNRFLNTVITQPECFEKASYWQEIKKFTNSNRMANKK